MTLQESLDEVFTKVAVARRTQAGQDSQAGRLLDVFVLGPALIAAGLKVKRAPRWARRTAMLAGAATIIYSGVGYIRQRRAS